MQIRIVDHHEGKAEGDCCGFPYNTELVNSDGVSVLFWTGDRDPAAEETMTDLEKALRAARNHRDVVCALACPGNPTSYWAHEPIPRPR